ncbi:MAG: histidine kinase N-terminal domain-containing protein [Chloroflexi bacterium]|nr:histidine kinase N-terminal domain-containing protein [Chloroflexota bacterium]
MVAVEPVLTQPESPAPPRPAPLALRATQHLRPEDRALLDNVAGHLPLLADLTHADTVLFARVDDQVMVIAQAQPVPVPSPYARPVEVGRTMARDEAPPVFRVLVDRRRSQVTTTVIRGAPVLQEVFAIRNERGETVGALRSEMLLIEHERQRKRHAVFRRAIARARDLIIAGRMRGGEKLGRLGVHDGVMVIDSNGRIEYLSAPAEYLYRRLGYADNLVKTQLQELETNEYICFKAMERGVCLEQRAQEHELVWIKRVVPLVSSDDGSLPLPFIGRRNVPTGAIVAIEDVTDELQNEQELKIKTAMIQEIHHRVKNNLQTIAALLRLQARRTDSDEVAEQLRESVGRIISIAVVHEFLSHEENSVINIHEVSNRILGEVRNGVLDHTRPITLSLEGTRSFVLPAQQATSTALIINELVQNAVEHAFVGLPGGSIVVRLAEQGDSLYIEIADDGRGLPDDFDPVREGGLGLQIVRSLVREDLKGQFELLSASNGKGVSAVVSFPKWMAKAE